MGRSTKLLGALVIGAVTLLPVAQANEQDDKDVIEYRQRIMHTLNAQAAILGQIVSGLIPKDDVVAHLDAIALTASTALKSFEPKVPGGESKDEVWANWDDFSERMGNFAKRAAEATKVVDTLGPDAALTSMLEAMSCKGCHQIYRE